MRRTMIAGNAKMNLTTATLTTLLGELVRVRAQFEDLDIVYCPPFTLLSKAKTILGDASIGLGGQNMYWEPSGAFTGEISSHMLVEMGCDHVILGHSERRQFFQESNHAVAIKAARAMQDGLIPIVCIGERLEEREGGHTERVLKEQLRGCLEGLAPATPDHLVLAYEPVWAIGTGKTATPEQAQEAHDLIRSEASALLGKDLSQGVRILYGGSVKGDNAGHLMACSDVDGALVGGASLTPEAFLPILLGAQN